MTSSPSTSSSTAVRAMVLAAGRGERMRPLTDTCPKPLLPVQGKPLMQYALEALARGGCAQTVVNTAWLGAQIEARFGNVFRHQPAQNKRDQLFIQEQSANSENTPGAISLPIAYSHEGRDFGGALETAGGVARALPLLGGVFWVLAGDVFAPDFVFDPAAVQRFAASGMLAHLWLVPNPEHNPRGDFGLGLPGADASGPCLALNLPKDDPGPRYTYSTIGLYRKALFASPWCDIALGNPLGTRAPLAPLLRRAMDQGRVSAEIYSGRWTDVGTPSRLAELNG